MEKTDLYSAIIDKLTLYEEDRISLIRKRGFTDDVIKEFKFRSCGPSSLSDPFFKNVPERVLNDLRNKNIVIPYFDLKGNIIHLRSHKYGIKDEPIQVYIPYKIFNKDTSILVIAESEFKAIASCMLGVNAIGIPGIRSCAKTRFNILKDTVEALGPKEVIICFDNEVKDDPKLEKYKADYTKRYDTQYYAYIMGALLSAAKINTKIATLNDEWRDAGGKADIDGILAAGVTPTQYKKCLLSAMNHYEFKNSWKLPPSHLSYLERRIDRFFYKGPIVERNKSYFYQVNNKPDEKISNFIIEITNTIQGKDGAERQGRFVSNYGPSKEFMLTPEVMSSQSNFTRFCYEHGDYEFSGNDMQMKKIWSYIFMHQKGQIINKIPNYGYDDDSKIWFFANGAYSDDKFYNINDDGIIWVNDTGYKLSDNFTEADLSIPVLSEVKPEFTLQDVFEKLASKLGDQYAKLLLSWALGCFFLPEIMEHYGIYPFVFIFGKTGAGKTTITNWISSFFGLEQKSGIPFAPSSLAGIIRITSQMSMLPIWFEEYRNKDKDIQNKNNFLRTVYDKKTVIKATKIEDQIKTYKARSTLIISGEEHPSDSALNSRFIMFPVFDSKNNQDAFLWLQKNKSLFNYFGHDILTRKKELWPLVHKNIEEYISGFRSSSVKVRDRTYLQVSIIGGICDTLLGDSPDFSMFIGEFARANDVKREGEQALFIFIEDIINLIGSGKIPFDFADIFTEKDAYNNEIKKICIWFSGLYNIWEVHFKGLRTELPASRNALVEHFKNEKYYLDTKQKKIGGKNFSSMIFLFNHNEMPEIVRNFFKLIEETKDTLNYQPLLSQEERDEY